MAYGFSRNDDVTAHGTELLQGANNSITIGLFDRRRDDCSYGALHIIANANTRRCSRWLSMDSQEWLHIQCSSDYWLSMLVNGFHYINADTR